MSRRLSPHPVSLVSVVVLTVILTLVVVAVVVLFGWRSSLNPFREETVDRTGSPVIRSLTDLSEYHAASAHYETVVDMERDTEHLPDWVSGERLLYVAKGDVDAVVDFAGLDERRVLLSEDGTSATIRMPAPTVAEPVLDLENSYVAHYDQGVVERFQDSDLERQAQLRAIEQMTRTATGEGMLADRAEENTRAMLEGLLGSLGYDDVEVTFDEG